MRDSLETKDANVPFDAVLVVGSLNMDHVIEVSRLPLFGETLLGTGPLKLVPGGKGANQAVAMARLGASVMMAGCVGNDSFGPCLLEVLQKEQIDTRLVHMHRDAASGVAFIFLSPAKKNAIVVSAGTNQKVGDDAEHLSSILRHIPHAKALVLQLETPVELMQILIQAGHRQHIPVILNLAPVYPLSIDILRQVDVLVLNEIEASSLSGQLVENREDAQRVAWHLHQQGLASIAITLGAQGAGLLTPDEQQETRWFYQPAPEVHVIDTTAAGDCFVGALTVTLLEKWPPAEALRFAVHASSLKVTKFGAISGLPRREEVLTAFR